MHIKITIKNQIGILTVNREKALNAMNIDVLKNLYESVRELISNQNIGVIILTGAGEKAFIAGADIKLMKTLDSKSALAFGKLGQKVTSIIEKSSKPIIAAVNGFALGGGCEIALACHLRYASDNALFSQPEIKLGLIPGWGGTQRLPRIVGIGNATELIISGEMINAKEALRIGLINKIFDKNNLMNETINFANKALENSPNALAKSIVSINDSSEHPLSKGLKKELQRFSELFDTEETHEGLDAFITKRKPKFRRN